MEEDPAPRRSAAARCAEVEEEVQCTEITGQKKREQQRVKLRAVLQGSGLCPGTRSLANCSECILILVVCNCIFANLFGLGFRRINFACFLVLISF